MNGNNNIYFVLFGADRYRPENHLNACRYKFDHISDARKFARRYRNAYIFKAHFAADTGALLTVSEIE